MKISLHDEILLVADRDQPHLGKVLLARVLKMRETNGNSETFTYNTFYSAMDDLLTLEELEPWVALRGMRTQVVLRNVHFQTARGMNTLDLYFQLTKRGWQRQSQILNSSAKENNNFKSVVNLKTPWVTKRDRST